MHVFKQRVLSIRGPKPTSRKDHITSHIICDGCHHLLSAFVACSDCMHGSSYAAHITRMNVGLLEKKCRCVLWGDETARNGTERKVIGTQTNISSLGTQSSTDDPTDADS